MTSGPPSIRAAGFAPAARRALATAAPLALLGAVALLPGCYAPQLGMLRSGLDSLRTTVDTLQVRDSVTFAMVRDMRREVAEQRDILLSTRATAGSTTKEVFDQMTRLEGKLDEVMGRFQQVGQRSSVPPATAEGGDPNQLYDQATLDLTQGRYALAQQNYREFLRRYPSTELSDNAQYGVAESFFAQSQFDSAAAEYARVETGYPQSDKLPAALYKLALTQEKLDRKDASRKTFEDLIRRFPNSGEAQLARERTGSSRRR
jgi:tol-pal system protein YbgF